MSPTLASWLEDSRYVCMYVWYVRDSVYLCDLFKRRPAPGLGTRSTATRPGCEAWVRGQERISCCTLHINELNCKTMDREERLRRRREYERARRSAETAEQKELHLSRRRESDRARRAARTTEQHEALLIQQRRNRQVRGHSQPVEQREAALKQMRYTEQSVEPQLPLFQQCSTVHAQL